MKTIIDQNGEIVEVEETNELMVRELTELGTNLAAYDELDEQLSYIKEQMEQWEIANRENILNVMKANGEKTIRTPKRTYSFIPETTKKVLDIERLKKDGIYDNYLKLTKSKENLRITRRKNDR